MRSVGRLGWDNGSGGTPYTPPDPALSDFIEEWTAANANWEYDGDESFTEFPGYLAVDPANTSTVVLFTPEAASFLPYSRGVTAAYPLHILQTFRMLAEAEGNQTFGYLTVSVDGTYTHDWCEVYIFSDTGAGFFAIELNGELDGVPFDTTVTTDIPIESDVTLTWEVIVTGYELKVFLNSKLYAYKYGFVDMATIGFISMNIQYDTATRQGMIARTEIFAVPQP